MFQTGCYRQKVTRHSWECIWPHLVLWWPDGESWLYTWPITGLCTLQEEQAFLARNVHGTYFCVIIFSPHSDHQTTVHFPSSDIHNKNKKFLSVFPVNQPSNLLFSGHCPWLVSISHFCSPPMTLNSHGFHVLCRAMIGSEKDDVYWRIESFYRSHSSEKWWGSPHWSTYQRAKAESNSLVQFLGFGWTSTLLHLFPFLQWGWNMLTISTHPDAIYLLSHAS